MATPRAAATDGGLCFFHANPNKVSELGRIGGRSKHKRAAENCDPLPTVDNAVAVRDTVADRIRAVPASIRRASFRVDSWVRIRPRRGSVT